MNRLRSTPSHLRFLVPASVLVASVFILIGAAQIPRQRVSSVEDWTHHHLLYSRPSTWATAWKVQQEPRYWQQKIRRGEMNEPRAVSNSRATFDDREAIEARRFENSANDGPGADWARDPFRFRGGPWHGPERAVSFERDWGTSLGAGGSTGVPVNGTTWFPVYPAKFSFDTTATPDCT